MYQVSFDTNSVIFRLPPHFGRVQNLLSNLRTGAREQGQGLLQAGVHILSAYSQKKS
jgi:hypothetical protein